jgi:hypothetical protein
LIKGLPAATMPRKSLRLQIAQEAVIQILSAYLPPLHFHHLPSSA